MIAHHDTSSVLASLVAHADWSVDPRKRWVAVARLGSAGRILCEPRPVGDVASFLARLRTEAETHFLLKVARESGGLVRGVVGWADLAAADAPARIASLAGDTLLKGLRPMLHDIPDRDWILRVEVQPALAEIAARRLVFDALIRPQHLRVVLELARRRAGRHRSNGLSPVNGEQS